MSQQSASLMPELPEAARCPSCGYCLRGSSIPRCPECGAGFDPDAILKALAPRARTRVPLTKDDWKVLRPPGLREWVLMGLSIGWLLWLTGGTDIGSFTFAFGVVPAGSMLLFMLIDLARIDFILRRGQIPIGLEPWRWKRRVTVIAPLFVVCVLMLSPWPPVVQFWLSKPALDRLAQRVIINGDAPDQWVGFYHGRYVKRIGNGMNFRLGYWEDNRGLEYIRPGLQPERDVQYRHLGGGWYLFYQ